MMFFVKPGYFSVLFFMHSPTQESEDQIGLLLSIWFSLVLQESESSLKGLLPTNGNTLTTISSSRQKFGDLFKISVSLTRHTSRVNINVKHTKHLSFPLLLLFIGKEKSSFGKLINLGRRQEPANPVGGGAYRAGRGSPTPYQFPVRSPSWTTWSRHMSSRRWRRFRTTRHHCTNSLFFLIKS